MKSRNQVTEIQRVQVLAMDQQILPMSLRKQIESRGSEATAPGVRGPGAVNSRSANDGRGGKIAAAPGAPAPIQQTVFGQPRVELLARYLQQFGRIGFVVAGDLQNSLDELAFGLV